MLRMTILTLALAGGLVACASATGTGAKGEALSLFQPADQTLRRGDLNRVSVIVRREQMPDGVDLDVENLPAGVELVGAPAKIAAGSSFGEFTLYARPDADLVTGHAVQVTARTANGVSVSQWFHLDVKAN
jgi:hypothetical protein